MATEELRQNFHRLIDTIADEKSLVELYSVAELYIEQRNVLLYCARGRLPIWIFRFSELFC